MLNTRQAAEKLGIPTGTVYRYIYSGILPAYKLGGNEKSRRHWHIREVDLEAFFRGETMAIYNNRQSVLDEALGEYANLGFRLVKNENDDLELYFKDKLIATYFQQRATIEIIREGCRNYLKSILGNITGWEGTK